MESNAKLVEKEPMSIVVRIPDPWEPPDRLPVLRVANQSEALRDLGRPALGRSTLEWPAAVNVAMGLPANAECWISWQSACDAARVALSTQGQPSGKVLKLAQ
jgi:hypothetical protein